jgi:hypothetical protein
MGGMAWRMTDDVAEFFAAACAELRRDRARNTVILTVAEQVRVNPAFYARSAPQFGWRSGQPGAACSPGGWLSSTRSRAVFTAAISPSR